MTKILTSILTLLISFSATAGGRTVLISDIDDTLKIAYSFGPLKGVQYFRDTELRFTGMSELYRLLWKDQEDLQTYYVSVAPHFLMKNTHLRFLKNGQFPEGSYFGRSEYSADQHKLETIRAILRQEKPEKAILVGDDGQIDAAVYREISRDAEFSATKFFQFIHIVSSEKEETGQAKVTADQTAYLTSIELAVEMGRAGLLKASSVDFMMKNVLPKILGEWRVAGPEQVEVAFPYFANCRSLVWTWAIPGLDERAKDVCHLR